MSDNNELVGQRAAVFDEARRNFRIALAREDLTQNKVAAALDISPSTLSSKLSKDHVTGFESLVVMPEMAGVVVALLDGLAQIYRDRMPIPDAAED